MVGQIVPQFARRVRQIRRILLSEGSKGVSSRVRVALAERIRPKDIPLPVRPSDVMAADLAKPANHAEWRARPGERLVINWVMSPPAPGSGGHTTVFRMIHYLEERGYINRVYFYDPYCADHQYYKSVVRDYYRFEGPVGNVDDTIEDAHAIVATSWPTAYLVYNARSAGKRFYFVQDFEPFFHPVSAASVLAENTYRMGFHAITAGGWLAEKLRAEFGMVADHFDFGCDTSHYRYQEQSKRDGISYYARRDARRGYELGIMALEIFAKRRPDIKIHFYGDQIGDLPFPVIDHGWATPDQLNNIYNRCLAGLSLSLTNVSLVPHEMLAAGCIPVVNEAGHNRIVLNNSFVRYAQPTPQALAAELEAIADDPDFLIMSREASRSVRFASWDQAGASVEAIFSRMLRLPDDRVVVVADQKETDIPASTKAESF